MSRFTAPSWDVDGKANTLCDNFSGGRKLPKNKRVCQKYNANPDAVGREPACVKQLSLKKDNIQVQVKRKQNNSQVHKDFKKRREVQKNVNVRHSQWPNGGNGKISKIPFGKKQNLKNFKHCKSDFIISPEECFSQKSKLHVRKQQQGQRTKENCYKPSKVNFLGDGENINKKGNFHTCNHSSDVSFHQEYCKGKNRKRDSAHFSDFQNNGPSLKKKRIDNVSDQEIYTFAQKQVVKEKQFPGHKKLKKQVNNVLNKNCSENQNEEMKSPFLVRNIFYDSTLSLRERMLMQLKSSRFRYINEQLYTSDSKDAEKMFRKDPNLFKVYHEGFRQQVQQWPENPLEKIIKAIRRKPANLVVADFGCGDAKLAKSVPNKVYSFDLVALSDEVTVCDMAHTPLESGCVDICVFCLSLMGTNLSSYLLEANRILKVGSMLKIAEVASRFTNVEMFIRNMKKYKFSLIKQDLSNDLFYFLDFQKDSNIKKKKELPAISLNPCWYKKR